MVRRAVLIVLGLLLFPGCHLIFPFSVVEPDAGDGAVDQGADLPAADRDLPTKDLPGTPTCSVALIGKPCKSAANCAPGGFCVLTSGAKGGVCSCSCTPDDPKTSTNEDSCPGKPMNICASYWTTWSALVSSCFQTCVPRLGANDCQGTVACDPLSAYVFGTSGFKALCAYRGCSTGMDCPVVTAKTCTATSSCETGEQCVSLLFHKAALEARCAKKGTCDLKSGLCGKKPASLSKAGAKVGDHCKSDLDCDDAMRCLFEVDAAKYLKKTGATCAVNADCCSGTCTSNTCTQGVCPVYYRNGYCTIKDCAFGSSLTVRKCPSGSTCNLGYNRGTCQRTCSLSKPGECRGSAGDLLGDYECRAWDRLLFSLDTTRKTASTPVCDFGPNLPCETFKGTAWDCSAVGAPGNPTKMTCRSLGNKALVDKHSPVGFCLDDTASGVKIRSPLP